MIIIAPCPRCVNDFVPSNFLFLCMRRGDVLSDNFYDSQALFRTAGGSACQLDTTRPRPRCRNHRQCPANTAKCVHKCRIRRHLRSGRSVWHGMRKDCLMAYGTGKHHDAIWSEKGGRVTLVGRLFPFFDAGKTLAEMDSAKRKRQSSEFDMAGVAKENVDITIDKNTLTVTGKAEPDSPAEPNQSRRETFSSRARRSTNANPAAEAACRKGRAPDGSYRTRRRESINPGREKDSLVAIGPARPPPAWRSSGAGSVGAGRPAHTTRPGSRDVSLPCT